MDRLLHSVIWPAVAGNILWSFLYVLFDKSDCGPTVTARLVALGAIGIYLAIDWIDRDGEKPYTNKWYLIVDLLLALSLAAFAITTQLNSEWAQCALIAAFVVAVFGHCFGVWVSNKLPTRATRRKYAIFNGIGLTIHIAGLFAQTPTSNLITAIAISLVVVLFLCCRTKSVRPPQIKAVR